VELEADLMYHELRRKTYITPKSYLDGIQLFLTLLNTERDNKDD